MADPHNNLIRDPRFCVGLDLSLGWPSALEVIGIGRHRNTLLINYEHAPVRCRFCFSLTHRVADCTDLKSNPVNSNGVGHLYIRKQSAIVTPLNPQQGRRASDLHGRNQAEPPRNNQAKPLEDQQGFMEVRRKNALNPPRIPEPVRENPSRDPLPLHAATAAPTVDPGPQLLLTSEQVANMLASTNAGEEGIPMTWSPGCYGRNPSAKRNAGSTSTSSSPVKSSATSKRQEVASSESSPGNHFIIDDEAGKLCILLDQTPKEAFKKIDALRGQGFSEATHSGSNLSLQDFPSLNLASPEATGLGLVAVNSLRDGPLVQPPSEVRPCAHITEGQPVLNTQVSSGNTNRAKSSSVRIAATYKAKWNALSRRLDEAASDISPVATQPNPPSSSS
ncbi:hypothetical protein M758_UG293700 [Ceratodon purpureus]|nr:hypothetical protein M758_UG293700 [Ceratodon purpureus]